jgi:Zn-finger nucleic acid-binding protein
MTTRQGLSCLSCGESMAQRDEHGVTIDYCPSCGGVWLDPGELEALTESHGGHHRHHHSDHDDEFEDEFEEEYEEEGEEAEDEGILGTIASALGGDEEEEGEFEEEGGFEEEEGFEEGGEEEF